MTLQLSTRTVAWLADRPRARELVGSGGTDTLTDLERAGHHSGAIAALRFVLVHHQPPTPTGRCPHCRFTWRRLWRRRPWPCVVWRQIHHELLGPFARAPKPGNNLRSSPGLAPNAMSGPLPVRHALGRWREDSKRM